MTRPCKSERPPPRTSLPDRRPRASGEFEKNHKLLEGARRSLKPLYEEMSTPPESAPKPFKTLPYIASKKPQFSAKERSPKPFYEEPENPFKKAPKPCQVSPKPFKSSPKPPFHKEPQSPFSKGALNPPYKKIIPCHTTTILYYIILYYTVLYYTVLYYKLLLFSLGFGPGLLRGRRRWPPRSPPRPCGRSSGAPWRLSPAWSRPRAAWNNKYACIHMYIIYTYIYIHIYIYICIYIYV